MTAKLGNGRLADLRAESLDVEALHFVFDGRLQGTFHRDKPISALVING